MWVAVLLLAAFFCALPSQATGEEKASTTTEQSAKKANPFSELSLTSGQGPISIRSHKLEFFYNEKRVVYRGDVTATRGDGTLKSDELTVTYEDAPVTKAAVQPAAQSDSTGGVPSGQRIKEAVAEGNVEITSTDRRATCKKAIFNEVARTVVLSGDAVLRQGENEVRGQTVTVYLDEGRTVVERGSDSEVFMRINQQQKGDNKKGQENSKKGGQTP
jgi:lipopolysaccharide export system protein LptA